MKLERLAVCAVLLLFVISAGSASAFPFFNSRDPLAPRDDWGELHQMPSLNPTDLERREAWRLFYYSKSRYDVAKDPAYVGALEGALARNGYYCGPADGVYSPAIPDAIARLQKAHGMKATGNLTVAVRRALHLP